MHTSLTTPAHGGTKNGAFRQIVDDASAARSDEPIATERSAGIYVGKSADAPQGVPCFDPAAEYRAYDFRLRRPAVSVAGLTPVIGDGVCLEPHIADGDVLYFDPNLGPADGDFVLTNWSRDELARAYSRPVNCLLTKWLRVVHGHALLLCNDGARPLGPGHTILGVLRRVERNGRRLDV